MRLSLLSFLLAISFSGEAQDRLISGPGSTLTESKCGTCHELQHIRRAPLSRGEWADNVRNMRERGAPLSDAEMALIVDYLSTYYNREKPPPAPGPDDQATGGDPIQKLLHASGCLACHALEQRVAGPAFKEVALKYSGDAGAPARLAAKIRQGGQGVWGQVPMPPNPAPSGAEISTLVRWILQQE